MRMLLKILIAVVLLPIILLGLFAIMDSLGNWWFVALGVVIFCVRGAVFGAITNYIAVKDGYDGGFAWGFWLGIIGIIVVGVRGSRNSLPAEEADRLRKLNELHKEGILTDQEFNYKKAEILKKM